MSVTKSNKSQQLTIEQENAIDLLIIGKSDREVSESVKVSFNVVSNSKTLEATLPEEDLTFVNLIASLVWKGLVSIPLLSFDVLVTTEVKEDEVTKGLFIKTIGYR